MQLTGQLTTMPADGARPSASQVADAPGSGRRADAAPGAPGLRAAPAGGAASTGPSDEALVQRLRDGDVAAGEVLARRYYEPLMR